MKLYEKNTFLRLNEYEYKKESRSEKLSLEETIKLLKDNCDIDYCLKYPIYRGTYNDLDYSFIDPKLYDRSSANTLNFYTIIIDNSPLWKDYPKRSQSIICSTDWLTATSFGDGDFYYHVFPYKGAKFGICPTTDFWDSFQSTIKMSLDDFNSILMYDYNLEKYDSYEKIKSKLEDVGVWDKIIKEKLIPQQKPIPFISTEYYGNEFKTLYDKEKIENKEVWTDSKCILIKSDLLEDLIKKIKE